jgi:MFS-type transporter involved in bile tolerance (Atg22 family)
MFKVSWHADQVFFTIVFSFAISVLFNFMDGFLDRLPSGRNTLVSNLCKALVACFILILLYKVSPEWSRTLFKQ